MGPKLVSDSKLTIIRCLHHKTIMAVGDVTMVGLWINFAHMGLINAREISHTGHGT